MDGEVQTRFLAFRFQGREGGQKAGTDAGDLLFRHQAARDRACRVDGASGEDAEGVDISGKGEAPSVAHLHRQLRLGPGRERNRSGYRQPSESLHAPSSPSSQDVHTLNGNLLDVALRAAHAPSEGRVAPLAALPIAVIMNLSGGLSRFLWQLSIQLREDARLPRVDWRRSQVPRVEAQMIFDEGCDEEVAMVVAFPHA